LYLLSIKDSISKNKLSYKIVTLLTKIKKMKFKNILFFVTIVLLLSCEKTNDNPCEAPDTISMINNGPKIIGWPIEISVSSYSGNYKWVSPNGGTMEQAGFVSIGSNAYRKDVTTYADSGLYRIEIRNEDCLEYIANTQVKLTAAPLAPCSSSNNTSTSTVGGVGGTTYTNISFGNNGNNIQASGANGETLNIQFAGTIKPREGKYTTTAGSGTLSSFQVSCWITKFPYDFNDMSGQDMFVNNVNGKMQISFCSNQFTNPLGSSVIKVSGKIVEP
jgi:hypothetical protein